MYNTTEITKLIRKRRSIFPKTYTERPIDKAILEEILENANWAPTHRFTEPWRFKVIRGAALKRLSDFLVQDYIENTPKEKVLDRKIEKTRKKPMQAACIIAICMQRDREESVPEWEEIAAVACAVQNMWLSAWSHNIGAYWSSPKSIERFGNFSPLNTGEKCLGFFYMGYHDLPEFPGKRQPIEEKVVWLED